MYIIMCASLMIYSAVSVAATWVVVQALKLSRKALRLDDDDKR